MSWLLPEVRLPVGTLRTVKPLDMRGAGAAPANHRSFLPPQPKAAAERAPDRAPEPETTPSPARPVAAEKENVVEMRSKVEAALKEHGPMSVKQLRQHVECSWLAKLCSNLQKHGVIRKLGGGTRSGIYGLPGQKLDKDAGDEPRVTKKPKAAKKRKAAPARPKARKTPRAQPLAPTNGDARFAMDEGGKLGIEKGDTKLALEPHEFERLRGFIERTEPVWKAA